MGQVRIGRSKVKVKVTGKDVKYDPAMPARKARLLARASAIHDCPVRTFYCSSAVGRPAAAWTSLFPIRMQTDRVMTERVSVLD